MDGRTVLVTGGTGYSACQPLAHSLDRPPTPSLSSVGSHTVLSLLQEGATCVLADNLVNSTDAVLPRLRELAGDAASQIHFYKARAQPLRRCTASHPPAGGPVRQGERGERVPGA
jgi:UDP-glucose 4-epimerase